MGDKLRIVKWDEYQHYKDRDPPWVKFHVRMLQSEDWVTLADASKLLMCVCIVLGARDKGLIPNNPAYIKRVAYLDKIPDLKPLIECGFLEKTLAYDSANLADDSAPQANDTTETEEETEKEEEKNTPHPPKGGEWFDKFWNEYPHRGKLPDPKKPAREKFERKLKAGIDPQEIIAGAKRYAELVRAEAIEERLVCMAATWLNQERWNDAPPVHVETDDEREKREADAREAVVLREAMERSEVAEFNMRAERYGFGTVKDYTELKARRAAEQGDEMPPIPPFLDRRTA